MPHIPYIVFYDGSCRLCTESRRAIERLDSIAPLHFVNLRDDDLMRNYPMIDRATAEGQMFVLDPAHHLAGGFDAIVTLLTNTTSFRPVAPLLNWRPIRAIGWKLYRTIAANRHRLFGTAPCDGACAIPQRT